MIVTLAVIGPLTQSVSLTGGKIDSAVGPGVGFWVITVQPESGREGGLGWNRQDDRWSRTSIRRSSRSGGGLHLGNTSRQSHCHEQQRYKDKLTHLFLHG